MDYIPYTTEVTNIIAGLKKYPLVSFELNVDGSGCLLVKYSLGRYYQYKFSNTEMKITASEMANLIVARVESYFNGWAVRKGFAVR